MVSGVVVLFYGVCYIICYGQSKYRLFIEVCWMEFSLPYLIRAYNIFVMFANTSSHLKYPIPEPGQISFQRRGLLVKESVGSAMIPVVRRNGADGEVSVKWRSIDKSAINGKDYKGGEGTLVFKHTEV